MFSADWFDLIMPLKRNVLHTQSGHNSDSILNKFVGQNRLVLLANRF